MASFVFVVELYSNFNNDNKRHFVAIYGNRIRSLHCINEIKLICFASDTIGYRTW